MICECIKARILGYFKEKVSFVEIILQYIYILFIKLVYLLNVLELESV